MKSVFHFIFSMVFLASSVFSLPFASSGKRNAVRDTRKIWDGGEVPYQIDPGFSDSNEADILQAMKEIERATSYEGKRCLEFVPRTEHKYYTHIKEGMGCSSNIGRHITTEISLGPTCFYKLGLLIHELLHILGFHHEHNRPDRDNYVTVEWGNIIPEKKQEFDIKNVDTMGMPYDYGSIMHYSQNQFSLNNTLQTILPRNSHDNIGQRDGLSDLDINKIRLLYGCAGADQSHKSVQSTVSPPTEVCTDTLTNCADYGTHVCDGLYKPWAKTKCPLFCKFPNCGRDTWAPPLPTTTTSTTTTTPTPTTLTLTTTTAAAFDSDCEDTIDGCPAYGEDVCINYRAWAEMSCKRFCGLCQSAGQEKLPTTTKKVSTSPRPVTRTTTTTLKPTSTTMMTTTSKPTTTPKIMTTTTPTLTTTRATKSPTISATTLKITTLRSTTPRREPRPTAHAIPTHPEPNAEGVDPSCLDSPGIDCSAYPKEMCKSNPLFAVISCPAFCQTDCSRKLHFDMNMIVTLPMTTTRIPPTTTSRMTTTTTTAAPPENDETSSCSDAQGRDECSRQASDMCQNFKAFAFFNCRSFCHMCTMSMTDVLG